MSSVRNNGPKTADTRFKPGNPGRPPGARHRVTRAIEELLEGEHEALTRKAIDLALGGNMIALKLCLDRISPVRSHSPIAVPLPSVTSAQDALAASSALIAAVGAGELTADEAARVTSLLLAHRSLIEVADIERRLASLEARASK
ncbi:hypothetical protein GCM10022276_19870 [Sphingomonas limnosediminicola]|uniref:DUF5681 domain-containing protein n=1 Tax=Sphingomonas limnosediminicola TaxID=940133 RepID=A0ABP7LJZ4_9SPHN